MKCVAITVAFNRRTTPRKLISGDLNHNFSLSPYQTTYSLRHFRCALVERFIFVVVGMLLTLIEHKHSLDY